MPLRAIIEAAEFDALPDTTVLGKDSFVKNEKENKFFLNLPDSEAAKLAFNLQKSVEKLTANNAELLKQKGSANKEADEYKALGKTPEEIKELLESKRPEDIQALVAKHQTDLEAVKKSFEESLTSEKTAKDTLQRQLQETLTKATISKLRADHELNDTADFVLRDFIKAEPKEENGFEFVTRVYDESGSPALHAGSPMTPDQFVSHLREQKKFTAMFNAGDGGGSGQSARQAAAGTGKVFTVSREASKSNPQLYKQAKAEAEKVGATVTFTD